MNKWILAALLLTTAGLAHADVQGFNRSSFTATNDTTKCIAGAHFIDGLVIGGASAGGSIAVYNSTWTTTPLISSTSLGTVQNQYYNNLNVAGICYTTVSNVNGVTILYKK